MRKLVLLLACAAASGQPSYRDEIEAWRRQADASLRADDGWLTVAGLFWLKEGANTFGTDSGNQIVLPPQSAPARAGVFHFQGGRTIVEVLPGVTATIAGKPVKKAELRPDSQGRPDVIELGRLSMHVIKRGERYGIRLKDKESQFRREFTGRRWFPVKEAYRIEARFVPYNPPKTISVPNILGQVDKEPCPGKLVFTYQGKEYSLEPVTSGDQLFIIFRDQTSGKETYPAGRFLYASKPAGGKVTLDFNKAVNPPCAFTPYATCPLPPRQNHLALRIEAGELRYGH